MSARQRPDRTLSSGSVRAEVLRQERGVWYTFLVYGGGQLILTGHELRGLADLADELATEYETVRRVELARMNRRASKPLPFGRRRMAR